MCNNENRSSNCIADILSVINILQQNASCGENCVDTCDSGFLGCNIPTIGCNTRPVMLYTNNNTAWSMPTTKDITETTTYSTVFRVEKIDGNCCTFRVLDTNPDTTQTNIPYVATNSFFTMNLNCVCALKCLNDTFVECI